MEQHFTHAENRQSKISLSSEYGSPMASASCPTADAGRRSTHTPPVLVKDPLLSPPGIDYSRRAGRVSYDAHA